MLLQRYTLRRSGQETGRDVESHLVADYMGAAEYEFGANGEGRRALAEATLDKCIAARPALFIETYGRREHAPIEVMVMGLPAELDAIIDAESGIMKIGVTKEYFHTDDTRVVAWMRVGRNGTDPLLIIRADAPDAPDLVNGLISGTIAMVADERRLHGAD